MPATDSLHQLNSFSPAPPLAPLTADDLTAQVPAGSVDACTMIFVLSAIAPALQRHAIRRVAAALRPGGRLLFRCVRGTALKIQI